MIDARIPVEIGLKMTLWKHVEGHRIKRTSARAPYHLGLNAHPLASSAFGRTVHDSNPFPHWIGNLENEIVVLLLFGLVPVFLGFLGLLVFF
jgi:hypothetical protein